MSERKETYCRPKSTNPVIIAFASFLICLFCFILAICLSRWENVDLLEGRLYDLRMRENRNNAHYADPSIVVITLDEDSYKSIPEPAPLWMNKFTRLVKNLHEGGAKVVGFDCMMMKPPDDYITAGIDGFIDRIAIPTEKKKELSTLIKSYAPRFDCEFGQAVRETRSVLATMIEEKSGKYGGSSLDINVFSGKENLATINVKSGYDGVIRAVPAHLTDKSPDAGKTGEDFFSFSFLVACRAMGKEEELRKGSFLREIPIDKDGFMLINYVGPWEPEQGKYPFHYFSFRLIDDKARDRQFFADNFNGKIVLIGATDVSSLDLKKTPFTYFTEYPGVFLQAQAINTLLHRDFIRKVPFPVYGAVLVLLIVICFILGFRLSLHWSLPAVCAIGIIYWCATFFLFHAMNLWINLAVPLIIMPVVLFSSYAFRFFIVDKEKKFLRGALSRYVSKQVADEIMNNPCLVNLGGERRDITVLFSDINHFTTFSESNKPEEITSTLNEYFTLMEEVIFTHKGYLKQFVGDEIMVIFNAPSFLKDHKLKAVETALDMREALEAWRKKRDEEGKFHFDVKIGIHTGNVVMGNVGSPHRTEYAAIGDTVNAASRIMGLNKTFNTHILISEEVYNDVKDVIEAEDKGFQSVKGKERQLHIFAVTGRKNPLPPETCNG